MLDKLNGAVTAYAQAAKSLKEASAAGSETDGMGFAELVAGALKNTGASVAKAEAVSLQAIANQADINQVVTAVNEAEMALHTVIAVRDRVIQAYNDVIKMPI